MILHMRNQKPLNSEKPEWCGGEYCVMNAVPDVQNDILETYSYCCPYMQLYASNMVIIFNFHLVKTLRSFDVK